jgi:hypothetical protein
MRGESEAVFISMGEVSNCIATPSVGWALTPQLQAPSAHPQVEQVQEADPQPGMMNEFVVRKIEEKCVSVCVFEGCFILVVACRERKERLECGELSSLCTLFGQDVSQRCLTLRTPR